MGDPGGPVGDRAIAPGGQVAVHLELEIERVRQSGDRGDGVEPDLVRERRLAPAQLQQVLVRIHLVPGHGEHQLAGWRAAREDFRHEARQRLRECIRNVYSGSERPDRPGYTGVFDSTISAPSASRRTFLISWSICVLIAAWLAVGVTMCSRRMAIRIPWSGLPPLAVYIADRDSGRTGWSLISDFGKAVNGSLGSKFPVCRVLDGIEDARVRPQASRNDSGAVDHRLVADAAAVRQEALRREDERYVVPGRGPLTGRHGLFADGNRDEVGGYRDAGPGTGTSRHPFRVVRIAGLARPTLIACPPATKFDLRLRRSARVVGTGVELVRRRLRVNNGTLLPQAAAIVESNGGASMANATSLPDVDRMSFVLYGSLNATVTQYIGNAAKSGFRPSARPVPRPARARPDACRNASHSGGAPVGSGPVEGWASNAPLHVTERSPRIFRVSSAFTWPAFGIPTRMPACCRTVGSDTVDSILPKSSGGPGGLVEIREESSTPPLSASETPVGHPRERHRYSTGLARLSSHEARADAVLRLRPIDVGLARWRGTRSGRRNRRVNACNRGFLEWNGDGGAWRAQLAIIATGSV